MRARVLFSTKCLTTACLVVLLTGCTVSNLLKSGKDKFPQADAKNPVAKMLCLWEPADGHDPNGLPSRGLAGQILFFTRGSATPVQVDGDVRVYVFDDQGTREEQSKPIHQFDFLGDAWKIHLQETTLGPAYHVFVPHTRRGHHQTECALRVRFKPAEGPVIFSDMVNVTLPGPTEKPFEQAVQQTSATAQTKIDGFTNSHFGRNRPTDRSDRSQPSRYPSAEHPAEQGELLSAEQRELLSSWNRLMLNQRPTDDRRSHRPNAQSRRKFKSYTIQMPR